MSEAGPSRTYLALPSKVRKRLQLASRTTMFVWTDPDKLLTDAGNATEDSETSCTPPLEYFLIMNGLSASIEKTLYSPMPIFEMPETFRLLTSIAKSVPELTALMGTVSILLAAVGPWLVSKIIRKPIPFDVLLRAYSYQMGAILIPFVILLQIILFIITNYGFGSTLPEQVVFAAAAVQLIGGAWVSRQVRREGYDRRPHWAGASATMLLIAIANLAGLLPRKALYVPSEHMLPTLRVGDTIVANQWAPYWREPRRGEIVVFTNDDGAYSVMRVIGIPGDTVEIRGGLLWLNGKLVPRADITDIEIPESHLLSCDYMPQLRVVDAAGRTVCRFPTFRETLPEGGSYNTVDLAETLLDNFGPVEVPEGFLFLMGDNRDNSADSRVQREASGLGLVSRKNVIGYIYGRRLPPDEPLIDNED